MKKSPIKKAETGKSVKPTTDSTAYFDKKATKDANNANKLLKEKGFFNDETKKAFSEQDKSIGSLLRQYKKGKPGYDANGFPVNKPKPKAKFNPESPQQQIAKGVKKKMQAGGVVKPAKRVGPVDPNGAWTKVQERTLAGAKVKKVPLTKDKELDASAIERKQAGDVAKNGKWIQKAIKKPGALRAQLGAKKGEPIAAGKLAAAAKKGGKLGQRARLAQTLKKMKK